MAFEFPFSAFFVSHGEPIRPSKRDAYEDSLQQGYKKTSKRKDAAFDFIKLLCVTRHFIKKIKRQVTHWE